MTTFIAVANQKGGVGKTSIAAHLACLAHETGKHTLLVDLDQQGSATLLCSGDGAKHRVPPQGTVMDLWDDSVEKLNIRESLFGFDYLQASQELDSVDDDLQAGIRALHKLEDYGYDTIIIDCPPAPGVRQFAPLLIANRQVIPLTADALGTQGLVGVLMQNQKLIQPHNPELDMRMIVNMHKVNSTTQKAVIDQLQGYLGSQLMTQVLTDRELVKQALRMGKPVWSVTREPFGETWRSACEELISFSEDDSDKEVA
ncbi:ParA family protein [Acidithiobacillus ferrivorans]|nr:ParA family protein [Acidithiobacillus ferrivorans]